MAAKTTKRTRTWITKSGKVKTKTYYYKVEKGGKKTAGKASAKEYYSERKHRGRKTLSLDEAIDYLESKSATFEEIQTIKNDIKGDIKRGISAKTFTKQGLDARLENVKLSREENFLRQLGYSFEEFEEEFGYSKEYIKKNSFEDLGDGVYKLKGTDLVFIWDYDQGFVRK